MRSNIAIAVCVILANAGNAFSAPETLSLTLASAIKMAVEKNLDVRAELYTPAQYEADIRRNSGIYDPLLALQTTYSDATNPLSSSNFPYSTQQQNFLVGASVSQLFSTGGTAGALFNNNFFSNNSTNQYNNYWQSTVGLNFSQPLLRNFGRENTELNINVSRLSKFSSLEKFNSKLLSIIAQVRNEYFKLYSLREDLDVKKVSLDLAKKILADTRARVKAGVLPAMEILNAEYGVASREKELIDADKAVLDQEDVLRLLLQTDNQGEIQTVDMPRRDQIEVSEDAEIKRALERPDIKEQKRNLEITVLQTRVYSNKIKPDLSFTSSISLVGLDTDYNSNLGKISTFDYPVWSVGLNFSFPLGNRAAENDYRRSRLKIDQTLLQIRSIEANATNEVKIAVRGISSNFKQIDVSERGRTFAEERLRAFIRKNEVGLATTKDVLDVENDLAVAKSNVIKAVVNYNNAITRLWQASGELLERENIRVVEEDADKLYRNIR